MTDQNSILKGFNPQSETNEKKHKIRDLTQPGSNPRPLACEANDVPLHHSGESLGSQNNTGCIRGAYLRLRLVSSKTIPATKKPLVKNFETSHVFQCCPNHYRRKEIVSVDMTENFSSGIIFLGYKSRFPKSGGAHAIQPPPPPRFLWHCLLILINRKTILYSL